jgi:hypothetical protein
MKKKKEEKQITIKSSTAEYLTYIASVGECAQSFEMRYENENIWLTQKILAKLYGVDIRTISYHINKIFKDSELQENSVIRKFWITAGDGKQYETNHYNLQMVIAIGFKVDNERAVQFRKWANQIVKDYTIKGFVMNDERFKNGGVLTDKYFDEQLERIREIRLSERKFYQKVTDLYATAFDYDLTAAMTKEFFAKVQNKLHFAVHGQTAPEIIYNRADSKKDNMGLTTWEDAPDGKIIKSDIIIAKNYLKADELKSLSLIVNGYLDFAEEYAKRKVPLSMEDWAKHLDLILKANGKELLSDAGKISAEIAKRHAETEFEKYRIIQDKYFESDYDKYIDSILMLSKNKNKN